MNQQVHIKLYESERAVLRAACDIFSAYVSSGIVELGTDQEKECIERSIRTAIAMAKRVDSLVQSDSELPGFLSQQ